MMCQIAELYEEWCDSVEEMNTFEDWQAQQLTAGDEVKLAQLCSHAHALCAHTKHTRSVLARACTLPCKQDVG
jgi:hypothetical protein